MITGIPNENIKVNDEEFVDTEQKVKAILKEIKKFVAFLFLTFLFILRTDITYHIFDATV